ncbi:MAG: AAA family ATPase, partial [Alphaproteobacteria bacterium]
MHNVSEASTTIIPEIEREIAQLGDKIARVREGIGRVIIGQNEVVDQTLITILSGGHALLVGVPGLAKTRLAAAMGTVLGLHNNRVQFTPDLMPADILGSEVLEETANGKRGFRFIHGPVFCQLLMADEINRASPRTQSALLQAMQEHHVTVAGQRYDLPLPFHVLATQNPLEQEGTYPLPEAQLDRFLLQIDVDYPDAASERRMLLATTGVEEAVAEQVMNDGELGAAQRLVRRLPVGETVIDAILRLVRAARPDDAA